jgi:predicted nucleic acid-binding protein
MILTIVDSNILIDIFDGQQPWSRWSAAALAKAMPGSLVINQIVYAESAMYFNDEQKFDRAMAPLALRRESIPWDAARLAGIAHVAYRKSGGGKDRVLPDFLIGAHAMVRGHRLLTRDASRYRSYFPKLAIIAPDTHP